MKYILSEKEFAELNRRRENEFGISKKQLQSLCTRVADAMPVNWGWNGPDPKPWGCILTSQCEWYCDKCPVQEICPNESKEYSK